MSIALKLLNKYYPPTTPVLNFSYLLWSIDKSNTYFQIGLLLSIACLIFLYIQKEARFEEFVKLSKQADLIVIDRNISVGLNGALFTEVKSALYNKSNAKVYGFIAGLGGKDVTYKDVETICEKAINGKAKESEWYVVEEV